MRTVRSPAWLRGGAAALLTFAAASSLCAAAAAQRTLADALGALDLDAAASAATCAAAASGDALSAPCATTLGDLSAAAAALDYAAATLSDTNSFDYTAGDAAAFMTGALARAAASLPSFCEAPSRGGGGAAGNLSCAQELDVTIGSYLTRLGAARGTRPGCSAEAGSAAAGATAAALSLLTRTACLRAEPSRGGGYCLASLPAALQASGLAAALAAAAAGGNAAAAAAGLDPAVVCPALSAAGCCATSVLQAAQAALSLTCSRQRDALTLALTILPLLCSVSPTPLPPACPGFVVPVHAPPSASECAALGALASGLDDGVGCALPRGACPASACDLYCAFDDVTVPAYTTDAASPSPPPQASQASLPPPPQPQRGANPKPNERGGGAPPAAQPADAAQPRRSGGGGSGGLIAGSVFAVVAAVGGTTWLYRTGHLGACWAQCHALIMAWQGQAATQQGFELMGDGVGAAVTQWS